MKRQRVIKSFSLRELGHKVVFDYEDFQETCNDHYQKAHTKAEQMVAEAQSEVQTLQEESRQAGQQLGYQEGLKNAEEEIEKRVKARVAEAVQKQTANSQEILNRHIQAVVTAKDEWLTHWENAAIEIASAMAERILRGELTSQPKVRANMLREVFELATADEHLTVRLNPADREFMDEILQEAQSSSIVEVVSDSKLQAGDCVIDTHKGQIDGKVSTQLQRILDELTIEETHIVSD